MRHGHRRLFSTLLLGLASCRTPCSTSIPEPKQQPVVVDVKQVTRRELIIDDVGRYLWQTGKDSTYAPTTLEEREVLAGLVPVILAAAATTPPPDPTRWQADAVRAGMRLEVWTINGQVYWALVEPANARRGAGAYLFRTSALPEDDYPSILLEAPHADFDVGTGDIAARLFFDPPPGKRPRALFVNTIHRYQVQPGQRQKRADNPADVAHNPEHLFSAMTDAAAAALGRVVVIQLHGFADAVDDTDDARVPVGTQAVVSAGDKRGSTPTSKAIADELGRIFPGVRRFPEEVSALGATTNAQGRLLQARPAARFVHVEMSAELRKELRASPAKLRELGRILFIAE